MEHLGDITKISGYTVPTVDCIIGGSPCQDLSVAGKRAGLDGERSGLYIEQVRIVKEMRKKDELSGRTDVDIRPRYMLWENVPGAFSSNKGEDFRVVLEELAKVKDKDAVIPMPPNGKWTNSGCIMGDGWSIAWRVLDAQFWGVPQRRRRIALVADFGGQSAPEILFVRESVSGHTEPGEPKGQETSSDASRGIGADDINGTVCYGISSYDSNAMKSDNPHSGIYEADTSRTLDVNGGNPACNQGGIVVVDSVPYTLKIRSGCEGGGKGALIQENKNATLATNNDQYLFQPTEQYLFENHSQDSMYKGSLDVSPMLPAQLGTGGNNTPFVVERSAGFCPEQSEKTRGIGYEEEKAPTLRAGVTPGVVSCYSVDQGGGKSSCIVTEEQAPTLTCTHDGAPAVCYGINGDVAGTLDASYYKGCGMREGKERDVVAVVAAVDCRNATEDEVNGALQSAASHSLNGNNVVRTRYIVRRLTPLECERLQGYPDGWTDIGEYIDTNGKKRQTSDAARYKALGNSIALPPWKWVLKQLCACYERDATMASLFDGIGGFPYLWEQINGKGTCLWASEIEEFPIAVTKVRIL